MSIRINPKVWPCCSLLVLLVACLVGLTARATAQVAERTEELRSANPEQAVLSDATLKLQREFDVFFEIGFFMKGESSAVTEKVTKSAKFVRWMNDIWVTPFPEEFRRGYGATGLSLQSIMDYRCHYLGGEAFRAAWKRAPGLKPEHLLALMTGEWLLAEPLYESKVYKLHEELCAEGAIPSESVSLSSNGASAYLIWGALTTPAFWPKDKPQIKEEFIKALIECGLMDGAIARFVEIALESPFAYGDSNVPALTMAGKLKRGVLGYTPAHRDLLEQLAKDCEAFRAPGEEEPFADRTSDSVDHMQLRRDGYLDDFVAHILERVLAELYPGGSSTLKNGTLAEQRQYWNTLALQGWGMFWGEAKARIYALVDGQAPHSSDGRIAELRQLLDGARNRVKAYLDGDKLAVTAAEVAAIEELQKLVNLRAQDQQTLAHELLSLAASLGEPQDLSPQLREFEKYFTAHERDSEVEQYVRRPWRSLAMKNPEWAVDVLRHHCQQLALEAQGEVTDDTQLLSESAREGVIVSLQRASRRWIYPGTNELIEEMGKSGSDGDRFTVLANTSMFDASRAQALFEKAGNDLTSDRTSRPGLESAVIRGLYSRAQANPSEQSVWIAPLFVRLIQTKAVSDFVLSADPALCAWLTQAIPQDDYVRLISDNKLPACLKKRTAEVNASAGGS
jgi:hypothetical protein